MFSWCTQAVSLPFAVCIMFWGCNKIENLMISFILHHKVLWVLIWGTLLRRGLPMTTYNLLLWRTRETYPRLIITVILFLKCLFNWWSGGCGFDPRRVRNILLWRLTMKYPTQPHYSILEDLLHIIQRTGPSCSQLTMLLFNDLLKFTWSDTQIWWNFLLKKCE